MAEVIEFDGVVYPRSAKNGVDPESPPGESEILALNPKREAVILKATGWACLYPGTLNVRVEPRDLGGILLLSPSIKEPPGDVVYPTRWAHIPKLRAGYLYYSGELRWVNGSADVLFRRACNPSSLHCLEVFASSRLREHPGVIDDAKVCCVVRGVPST